MSCSARLCPRRKSCAGVLAGDKEGSCRRRLSSPLLTTLKHYQRWLEDTDTTVSSAGWWYGSRADQSSSCRPRQGSSPASALPQPQVYQLTSRTSPQLDPGVENWNYMVRALPALIPKSC